MQSTNKVALVTGASSGIGKAIAQRLHKEGWSVWGTSRNQPDSNWPEDVRHVVLDVTDAASVAACIAHVIAAAGQLDLVVNNAGVTLLGAIEETSDAEALGVLETNLLGVHRVVREVLPHFRTRGAGRFVCIGSIAGFLPKPYEAFYAAGKHALEAYCESLDHEVRHLEIRCVLIEPGYVKTGLSAAAKRSAIQLPCYAEVMQRIETGLAEEIENGCAPDEVAGAVLQAATNPDPHLRYLFGKDARILRLFRTYLPERFFGSQLRKRFGLP
ncbi:MAG: short-chain dehydrogenase/reductase [Azospirillum brasilense]|nr:MAG: short-chain dehydrogenase/reductase [Azospirillum brasilense]